MATEQLLLPLPDERPPLREACSRLCAKLGHPHWLSSVGIRDSEMHKSIVIFLRTRQHPEPPTEWEGYPIEVKFFGDLAPLGSVEP